MNSTYDAWLDEADEILAEDDYRRELIEMHFLNTAEEMAEWPLCETAKAAVTDRLCGLEWSDEQSIQLEKLLTKVAMGQPVGPSDCSLMLSRAHIIQRLAGDLIKA